MKSHLGIENNNTLRSIRLRAAVVRVKKRKKNSGKMLTLARRGEF